MMQSAYLQQRREIMLGTREPEPKKQPKPIAKRAKKMQKEHRQYTKMVDEMLKESDRCELCTPVCIGKAQGLHHVKRRGKNLMNRGYVKRACNPCNSWVEANHAEATAAGLLISKFKPKPVAIAEYDSDVKAIIVT